MGDNLSEKSLFNFECRRCGACCGSGLEIYLNSLDVWNLRNHFRMPTGSIIEKFLSAERRAEYGSYPLCLIRHREGRCPFHDGRLCSVHPARPAGCRMFPVTHHYGVNGESVFAATGDFDFCKGGEDAPPVTLGDWLAENSIGDYEKAIEIQRCLSPLAKVRLGESEIQALFDILFDFDSSPGFPFAGIYTEARESAAAALDWIRLQISIIISD